jgi:hypothetical protein
MTQAQQQCSTPEELLTFLRGQLSPQEESELQLHLNDCLLCRKRLEDAAADAHSWHEVKMFFGNGALQTSADDWTDTQDEGNHGSQRIRQVLDTLGPTDDPESLGRIGGYEVTGVIGAGGMGVVLKAHDRSLDRIVAIKVMSPHLASNGSARKRFAREAKAAAAVLHPNVIAIHSVASESVSPYLVMPYVRGVSLQKRIDAQGPLPLKDTLRIAAQISAGLAAAHAQGLVHRDIKPANILLEEGVERVTITDFGLARAVDDASMTCSGVIAGTPQYMSPEQARGETMDARSDLFSLGSVLYAMCAGRPPFRAETTYGVLHRIANESPTPVSEVNADVPVWLGHIISRMMAKRPDDRFASAAQVAELLEGCLAHVQQPTAMPLPEAVAALAPKVVRRPPSGKLIAAAAGAFSLLLAGILIVLELGKGTLTIESEFYDVPIRIMQGDQVVDRLTVTKAGNSVRVAAGTYIIELDSKLDGMVVENGQVTLKRGATESVKIKLSSKDPNVGNDLSSVRFETPEALMKYAADCQSKDDGAGFVACWTDEPVKQFASSYLLMSVMQVQEYESNPLARRPPGYVEQINELKQIFAEEINTKDVGLSALALSLAHKEIADRSDHNFEETAEATLNSPLMRVLAIATTDHLLDRRRFVARISELHKKYREPDGRGEIKAYSYTVEQNGDRAIATERRSHNKFGLIKTENGWRIDDLWYGLKAQNALPTVASDVGQPPPSRTGSSVAQADSGSQGSARRGQGEFKRWLVVDLYGGKDVLAEMNKTGPNKTKHVKLFKELYAIEGVQVNFRELGPGNDIATAIVRDPLGLMAQDVFITGKPSERRTAVAKALEPIQNVLWEEGQQASAPMSSSKTSEGNGSNLRFSESREIVLSMGTLRCMLDLDSGDTCPAAAGRSETLNRFDVMPMQAQPYEEPRGLTFPKLDATSLTFDAFSVAPELWSLPDSEVFAALAAVKLSPTSEILFQVGEPNMYVFRTAHKAVGIMQVLGTERIQGEVNEPWGIRIRYKMFRSGEFERATGSVECVMKYLLAVEESDTETTQSLFKGSTNDAAGANDMLKLLSGSGFPQLHKTWFEDHSAFVTLGPISSTETKIDGRFLLFTLSLVDERWSIVGIDVVEYEDLPERLRSSSSGNSSSNTISQSLQGEWEFVSVETNGIVREYRASNGPWVARLSIRGDAWKVEVNGAINASSEHRVKVDGNKLTFYGTATLMPGVGARGVGSTTGYGLFSIDGDSLVYLMTPTVWRGQGNSTGEMPIKVPQSFETKGTQSSVFRLRRVRRSEGANDESKSSNIVSEKLKPFDEKSGKDITLANNDQTGKLAPNLSNQSTRELAADTIRDASLEETNQAIERLLITSKMDGQTTAILVALVANRMASDIGFAESVLAHFEKVGVGGDATHQARQNLLAVLTRTFHTWSESRWKETMQSAEPETKNDETEVTLHKIRELESAALNLVVKFGRQANRSDIYEYARTARALHHPDARPFLSDILQNEQSLNQSPYTSSESTVPIASQSMWRDNVGGTWPDARFVAAIGLAEFGDQAGIEWLLEKTRPNDFGLDGSLFQASHARVRSDSLRESSRCALADLFGQPEDSTEAQLSEWWKMNKSQFHPQAVKLKSN